MTVGGKSSVLLVGVIVASLISAPVADARQTCHEAGSVVRCETNGSVSIKAVPTQRAPHAGNNAAEGTPEQRDHPQLLTRLRPGATRACLWAPMVWGLRPVGLGPRPGSPIRCMNRRSGWLA